MQEIASVAAAAGLFFPALFGMHCPQSCPLYSTGNLVLVHHGPARIESLDANETHVPGWPECCLHATAGGTAEQDH